MKDLKSSMESIVKRDSRYKLEAYQFVMAALNYTVSKLNKPGHLSGGELLTGIKEYARSEFGPMARTVFEHWGVTSTEDFGRIVFNMVEGGVLGKTDSDSLEDFKNGYDFKKTFDRI